MEELSDAPNKIDEQWHSEFENTDDIVDILSEGDHSVILSLKTESPVDEIKRAFELNYIHVKFTRTGKLQKLGDIAP